MRTIKRIPFMTITFVAVSLLATGIGTNAIATSENTTVSTPHRTVSYDDAESDMISGVVGGPHDFSDPRGGPGNACNGCHVPHMQAIDIVTAPAATTQPVGVPATQPSVQLYRIEGQRRVFVPDRYTPGPTSLVCLGCHDGTIATSTIGSSHAMLAGVRTGFHVPEHFVWRDHPIGVPYPAGHRNDYKPVSAVVADGRIVLPEGRIECISCHEPHDRYGLPGMLVKSSKRSALCLSCHIK